MGSPTADLFCCRSPWTGTAWPTAPVQQTGGGEGGGGREEIKKAMWELHTAFSFLIHKLFFFFPSALWFVLQPEHCPVPAQLWCGTLDAAGLAAATCVVFIIFAYWILHPQAGTGHRAEAPCTLGLFQSFWHCAPRDLTCPQINIRVVLEKGWSCLGKGGRRVTLRLSWLVWGADVAWERDNWCSRGFVKRWACKLTAWHRQWWRAVGGRGCMQQGAVPLLDLFVFLLCRLSFQHLSSPK